jgi:hypothetical protein
VGLDAIERWLIITEDGDFVGRVPETPVIVSGWLIVNEELLIVKAFEGA